MRTKDFILLGAGYAAGRLMNKTNSGFIGAVKYIKHKSGTIKKTGYKIRFAAKSLENILKKNGFDVELKFAVYSQSAYISADKTNKQRIIERLAEIRLSDHTKPGLEFQIEEEGGVYRNRYDYFEAEVLSAEQFQETKKALEKWVKLKK